MLTIDAVLSSEETVALRDFVAGRSSAFADGARTAGWRARKVKNNEQLDAAAAGIVTDKVRSAVLANEVFMAAARPKSIVRMLVSRYRDGMSYGLHVDDATMDGVRTDLSFTLFLAEPESYDGGELVIESDSADTEIKLRAGSLVLYPTAQLHRVVPVTRGERLAVVGWVRSLVRSPEDREVLFDLDNVLASLRQSGVAGAPIDRILKVRTNLLRRWLDD